MFVEVVCLAALFFLVAPAAALSGCIAAFELVEKDPLKRVKMRYSPYNGIRPNMVAAAFMEYAEKMLEPAHRKIMSCKFSIHHATLGPERLFVPPAVAAVKLVPLLANEFRKRYENQAKIFTAPMKSQPSLVCRSLTSTSVPTRAMRSTK